MADLPRPPRLPGQPPPLPGRPTLVPPVPPEPFVDLTADPAPDTVRTRRDEDPPPPLALPLTEETGRGLRRELVLLREALPTLPVLAPPVGTLSLAPASLRTMTKRAVGKALGKWSALTFLLPIIGAALAKRWPEYADLVDIVTGWLP